MMNEDYESFLRRGINYNGGEPEVYEDTHDNYGKYIGGTFTAPVQPQQSVFGTPPKYSSPQQYNYQYQNNKSNPIERTEQNLNNIPQFQYYDVPPQGKPKAAPPPTATQYISPRLYQNIVLYSPRNLSDVERLIEYMRRKEPAIVDLDPIADTDDAQRVLDFTSGAVYALNGRIIDIKTNVFLIVPDGIDVAKPDV